MKRCPICARGFEDNTRFCPEHGLPVVDERLSVGCRVGELSGEILDSRYRLAGVAGSGGMGMVYEAENLRIGRRCAVKVIHRQMEADPKMKMRLFREVVATARIRHPNVVEIWDYGHDERAGSYLVMEYLKGRSLGDLISELGRVPLPQMLAIGVQLTAGLSATHAKGLIHRDLKPSNIRLLPDGTVKILDFGLVKPFEPLDGQAFVTISSGGIVFGTPWYMSPEQACFRAQDPRSDVYSLGAVFYEMLTGRAPFIADNPMEVIQAQLKAPVPLPRMLKPPVELPAAAEIMLLRALAKKPEERYQSMAALTDELHALAQAEGISIAAVSTVDADSPSVHPDVRQTRPSSPDATLLATRAAEAVGSSDAPPMVALPLTQPTATDVPELRQLVDLARTRFDRMVQQIVTVLRQTIPRYRSISEPSLSQGAAMLLDAGLHALVDGRPTLPGRLRSYAEERGQQQFSLSELVGALWIGYAACRPLLVETVQVGEAQSVAPDSLLQLLEEVDRRVLPLVLRVVDQHVAHQNGKLSALNDALNRRNDELALLHDKLADRVRTTSSRLAETELLASRVADVIPSGLLLVERTSRRVLLFNVALQRMTGLAEGQVVGRATDELVGMFSGIPFAEFVEQVRLHGEVGLRKLHLQLPNGKRRAVYVRGQPYEATEGGAGGTLFVIEDVTERQQMIESFSSVVPQPLVEQVLSGHPLKPRARIERALLMAIRLPELAPMLDGSQRQPASEAIERMSAWLDSAAVQFAGVGGTIDELDRDALLVRFSDDAQAVDAACACALALAAAEPERDLLLLPRIGLHRGEVHLLQIGGPTRVIYTVIGEAARIATQLAELAEPGQVLISEAVASRGRQRYRADAGKQLLGASKLGALSTFRLLGTIAETSPRPLAVQSHSEN